MGNGTIFRGGGCVIKGLKFAGIIQYATRISSYLVY